MVARFFIETSCLQPFNLISTNRVHMIMRAPETTKSQYVPIQDPEPKVNRPFENKAQTGRLKNTSKRKR